MKQGEPRWSLLPPLSGGDLRRLPAMRTLRAFGDGFVVLLLLRLFRTVRPREEEKR
ncbi:MAG: hypothetical protein NTW37_05850 [Proteobacteria bacterium]|nr:hypothetical protein [Pseudomonadota bacterium]